MGEEIIIVPIFFAAVFGILYVLLTSRHRERMALIEKGLSAGILKSGTNLDGSLKWGMIAVGVSLGMILGDIATRAFWMDPDVAMACFPIMFGGIALITFYLLRRNKTQA